MKKLMTAMAAAVCAGAAYRLLRPIRAYAWLGTTHEKITGFALERLETDKKHKLTAFYKPYTALLIKGAKAPDEDGDTDKGSGTHHYVSADLKGKTAAQKGGYFRNRLGKYQKSARTSMEENYTSAVGLYKSGRTEDAMYVLGRALHFLEDIAAAPHSAGIKYGESSDNVHYAFEKYAADNAHKFPPESFDRRLIKAYDDDSFETPVNKLAAASVKFAPQIASLEPSALEKAVKTLVPLSAENAAALMTRFYDDCTGERANYLTDGGVYAVRSEDTGLFLTKEPKGTVLEKTDHSKEQRFTLVMSENGSFTLKAKDGTFLGADMKTFGKEGVQLRAAALGKSRFRLSAGEGFTKTVVSKRRSLGLGELTPGDKAQIWIIEKYK